MNTRMLRAATLLTLAALAAPGQAASAPPQEIALHIEATATAAPDGTLAVLRINGRGASREEANAALDAPRAAMNAALADLGVANKDRLKLPGAEQVDPVQTVDPIVMPDCAPKKCRARKGQEPALVPPPRAEFAASEEWQVMLRGPEAMLRLQGQAGEQFEVIPVESPASFYADPAKAREDAIAKAIANARDEANRYAAALGYKVVRIERVSNAKPALNMPDIVNTFMMMDKRSTREAMFQMGTMTVAVAIDFAIAPR